MVRRLLWLVPAMLLLTLACARTPTSTPPRAEAGGSAPVPSQSSSAPLFPALPQGFPASAGDGQTGIWVQGRGRVTFEPDLAVLTLTVEAQEKTVEEARARSAEAMGRVREALRSLGVAGRDIQTVAFSIQPVYRWRERVEPDGTRTGEQVLVGYQVIHTVQVKVRDLERVGEAVDRSVSAGGDRLRVQGVDFTVEDPSVYQAQARALAVQDALARARQFADLTGVALGPLRYITEFGPVVPVVREAVAMREAMPVPMPGEAPTPIAPGELSVEVQVQAVFDIR